MRLMPEKCLLNQKEEEKKQADYNTAYRTLRGIGVQPQGRAVSGAANYQFIFGYRKIPSVFVFAMFENGQIDLLYDAKAAGMIRKQTEELD